MKNIRNWLITLVFLAQLPIQAGALHDAVLSGNKDKLIELLELGAAQRLLKGIKIDGKDAQGQTPLIIAAMKDHSHIAETLLYRGANVDAADNKSETALIKAATNGSASLIKLLLKFKANVNAKDKYGNTALMMSIDLLDSSAATILLKNGADFNIKNNRNESPVERALDNGRKTAVDEILRASFSRLVRLSDSDLELIAKNGIMSVESYNDTFKEAMARKAQK